MILIDNDLTVCDSNVVVGCLCRSSDKYLFLKRNPEKKHPLYWCVPGGKVNPDEPERNAIIREVREETQLEVEASIEMLYRYFVDDGETQFSYYLFVADIDTPDEVVLNEAEHISFNWLTLEEACRLSLVPNMREILNHSSKLLDTNPTQIDLFVAQYADISMSDATFIKSPANVGNQLWFASFGTPCSGKTTTFKEICKRHAGYQLINHSMKILHRSTRLNSYLRRAFQDEDRRFFFHFQQEVIALRFYQAYHCSPYSLVDETIYSTLAYSVALRKLNWLTEDEFKTFLAGYRIFEELLPKPAVLFYFRCETKVLNSRMIARGRNIEKNYSTEYVDALDDAFLYVSRILSKSLDIHTVDTSNINAEDAAGKCYAILKDY